jgi:hypothetical protein
MNADGLLEDAPPRWPATEDTVLRVPPEEHILDHLVRTEVIFTRDDFLLLPDYQLKYEGPGTVALLEKLPTCDVCAARERRVSTARYDAVMVARLDRPWAYMCPLCFAEQGPAHLGTGLGQYLFATAEITPEIWDRVAQARLIWEQRLPG